MSLHPLTNFEIQKYYQGVHWFNGVYSRNNLTYERKDRTNVINLDEYDEFSIHCVCYLC